MSQRLQTAVGTGLAALAVALLTLLFWPAIDHPVRADERGVQDYASPLEVLLSPDGSRIYVLCQQSEQVRVLDATSYAVIKSIAVGRVREGFPYHLMALGCL